MEMKKCKYCDSDISINAQICPCCRSPQNRAIQAKGFGIILIYIIIIFLVITGSARLFQKPVNRMQSPVFSEHVSDLVVLSSELAFRECGECKGKNSLVVTGIIQNKSDISWESINIEVRLYDSQGKMIDSIKDSGYDNSILPKGEMSFRVMESAAREQQEYASHKVFINSARAEIIY